MMALRPSYGVINHFSSAAARNLNRETIAWKLLADNLRRNVTKKALDKEFSTIILIAKEPTVEKFITFFIRCRIVNTISIP